MNDTTKVTLILLAMFGTGLAAWLFTWAMESFAEYREYVHACTVQFHIRPMLLLDWLRAGKEWA